MKQLPVIYSQRDTRWSGQRLGTVDGITIGGYGCYITCFAMLASYYGKNVTPAQLDDMFTNNGWYISGNLLTDDGLSKAYPDIQYVSTYDYSSGPADLGKLQSLLTDANAMVILEVDFNPEQAGLQTHFVVALDSDGHNVTIADAWTGEPCQVSVYGDPATTIQKFVVYKGTPLHVATVNEMDQAKADRDINWNLNIAVFAALGVELDSNDKDGSKQRAVNQINELKKQIERLRQENQILNDSLSKLTQSNHDYTGEVLTVHNAQKATQNSIQALYDALGVTNQTDALEIVKNLKKPHDEVVKEVQPVLDAAMDAAIAKKPVPIKKTRNPIVRFFRWFSS